MLSKNLNYYRVTKKVGTQSHGMSRVGEEKKVTESCNRETENALGCCKNALKHINGLVKEQDGDPDQEKQIDCLIDAMYLQLLHLIEQQIHGQCQLERSTARAHLILARNRLQQGLMSCAITSRLPVATPYRALCRLVEYGRSWCSTLKLFRLKVDPTKGFFDPLIHIFGALVPHRLRLEHHLWEHRIEQIVECANIQRELQSLIKSIEQVKWARRNRIRNT